MLTIVKALKWWRVYLLEAKHQTIIKSDHKNLQYFMMTKKLNEWQAWWAEILVEYDFSIQYCKEKDNNWADILSRKLDLIKKETEQKKQAMLQTNREKQLKYIHYQIIQIEEFLNEQIKKKISQDKFTKKIIRKIEKHLKIRIIKKLLLFQELIYMSSATRKKMIKWYPDDTLTEYFEIDKTVKLIFRNYYFS